MSGEGRRAQKDGSGGEGRALASESVMSPWMNDTRVFGVLNSGAPQMSKLLTEAAPLSTSISTKRLPTKPLPPVTTQWSPSTPMPALRKPEIKDRFPSRGPDLPLQPRASTRSSSACRTGAVPLKVIDRRGAPRVAQVA